MHNKTHAFLFGLAIGFLLGGMVGTAVMAKAQGWTDPYTQTNQQIVQQQQAEQQWQTLQLLREQVFQEQLREIAAPVRPPC